MTTHAAPAGTEAAGDERPLRIALIGGDPARGGGVAGCAWTVVEQLTRQGCELDSYTLLEPGATTSEAEAIPGVTVIGHDTGWRWDRWYSNTSITKVLTGLAARAIGRRRLAKLLVEQHRAQPYDVIYQFSTIEVFGLRRHLDQLPPLVMHPSTHMAGELAGFRRERALAARCEPRWRLIAVEALLRVRARRQRPDIQLASAVIGISRVFADHLIRDYAVAERRVTVIPYPIDDLPPQAAPAVEPVRHVDANDTHDIVMVSRVSVRKGIDVFVELSHRLADLAGKVRLHLVGGDTLWSDYRPLLTGLDPSTATYHGQLPHHDVLALLAGADMLIQPATYEPFGLSVGEALACGAAVVATDQIGAAEGVASECCTIVPAGDVDAFERAVRAMLTQMASPHGPEIRRLASAEAQRLFSPERVGAMILDVLRSAARR
jgi:glycosyltransferase involved in cell wall biosynthesis